MVKIIFPVVELDNDKFQVNIDLTLYDKDVVVAAIHKFSHLFYIHQQMDSNNLNVANIVFESKENNVVAESIPKQFCNKQFGHIRDMIVKEAFKPVSK